MIDSSSAPAMNGDNVSADFEKKPRDWLRQLAENLGEAALRRLVGVSGSVKDAMSTVPARMHRVAEQSQLVLELVDDVRSGRYRPPHWYALPVAAAALMYAVSPADVVPDVLPLAGTMDDAVVVALAVWLLRRDLRDYCRFRGLPESQFFEARGAD
jgi:uncharacterized membrane protein YkvA (DUF1232 family)